MSKYSKMPPLRACLQKWHAGQLIHTEVFQGDPLDHLYEELIDAWNYLAVAEEQKALDIELIRDWRAEFEVMMNRLFLTPRKEQNPELKSPLRSHDYPYDFPTKKDYSGMVSEAFEKVERPLFIEHDSINVKGAKHAGQLYDCITCYPGDDGPRVPRTSRFSDAAE